MPTTPSILDFTQEVPTSTVGDTVTAPNIGSLVLFADADVWYAKNSAGVVTALSGVTNVSATNGTIVVSVAGTTRTIARAAITGDVSIPAGSNTATFAVDMATQAELNTAIANAVNDGDTAGGVLAGTYPNPSFAVDMATQVELDAHTGLTTTAHGGIVPSTRTVGAGTGLTGGGALSGNIVLNAAANADGSIVVNADDIQVGVLATDAQHGNRGGGALHANATTAVAGFMSAIDKKKVNTWTDLVNELGADPTGAVDATGLVTAWLAAPTSSTLIIPASSRVRIDGPVAWNKECNLIGMERRTSIVTCGNATNNIFNVSADGVLFEGFRVSAGTTADNAALRTAGFAFNFDVTSDSSGVRKCDILFQHSAVQSSGSLQFMEDLNIREYGNNAANGQCILIDGVGDRYIRRITTDNGTNPTGFAGIRVKTCASLVISDSNIIHAGNALELSPGNGQTVPSIEVVNCFLDTSVNGLAVVPTGTGVVARSKFTNCWMGTHTTNGILLTNPGGATSSFNGFTFINCDIYGCPTGINASAGGGKWSFQGSIAGCTTQAVLLGPSAEHFPKICDSVIGPHGLFGANALGIVVNVGTYKGLVIQDNSVVNNTGAALTLGVVTVAAGEAGWYRIVDNAGINPRGAVTTPAVAATGVAVTNTTGFRVLVAYKTTATIHTAFNINGVALAAPNLQPINTLAYIPLEPGGTITWTGGTAPTWVWIGQ